MDVGGAVGDGDSRREEARRRRRWPSWLARVGVVLCVVAGVLVAITVEPDPLVEVRADAAHATEALQDGDLVVLEAHLARNRGNADFAYYFASKATPGALGDALATVANEDPKARLEETLESSPLSLDEMLEAGADQRRDARFREGVDKHAYDLMLTDLAGALALATHGTGDRGLPKAWAQDFIDATTDVGTEASDQDVANKQNLLLLLARGYWSVDFLKKVTTAYWHFDRDNEGKAWPGVVLDAGYAPAPNGTYLTDGILALTSALTANPAASGWAFTELDPGLTEIDDSDYAVGNFAHYLFFEHEFPQSPDGQSIGMTATLTALSSAIDATGEVVDPDLGGIFGVDRAEPGPLRDSLVLRDLAEDAKDESGCSSTPTDYWNCVEAFAGAVWRRIGHWGHAALDILSLATMAPPPFTIVGIAATATNATWYAIDGDYAMAGLSLAAAVPLLKFAKVASTARTAEVAGSAATRVEKADRAKDALKRTLRVAKAAAKWQLKVWRDCARATARGGITATYGKGWSREQRKAADAKIRVLSREAESGGLAKTRSEGSRMSRSAYEKQTGTKIPDDHDLDHVIDRQLGGSDDLSNIVPLDRTVNRSIGKAFDLQLARFDLGDIVPAVAICPR